VRCVIRSGAERVVWTGSHVGRRFSACVAGSRQRFERSRRVPVRRTVHSDIYNDDCGGGGERGRISERGRKKGAQSDGFNDSKRVFSDDVL
jgi:hypothetical protein